VSKEQQATEDILCIGLDIAWFGGSANNKDSQYDCLGSVLISPQAEQSVFTLTRVPLKNRDPDSVHLLAAIDKLLKSYHNPKRIVFALDAPIQAIDRGLPPRSPKLSKGMVERRACENHLDKSIVGNNGWRPKIQPGAPLAPRVILLLNGLQERGFVLWTPDNQKAGKLVIECFPSEAIWAIKQMGFYPELSKATDVKSYKKQQRVMLSAEQVRHLVLDVLDAFAPASGNPTLWSTLVDQTINWMLNENTWQNNGIYKGGKLLDDVVDTMICLATSLSYTYHLAHVWQNQQQADDGHIIGPGFSNNGVWTAAYTDHMEGKIV
jgi:hypothetical protein